MDNEGALWGIVGGEAFVTERVSLGLEVQTRAADDVSRLDRVVVRPWLGYRFAEPLSGALGYDAHIVELGTDRLEQRVWQQLALRHAWSGLDAAFRVRLEERIFEDAPGGQLRLRSLLGLGVPLMKTDWMLVGREEVFFGLNGVSGGPEAGFDENRLFGGLSGPLGPRLRWEGGYQMRYIERDGPDSIQHTIMLVLRYRHPD